MRRGKAADSRGAPKLVSEALTTAVEGGCTGVRIRRADSQFYNAGAIAACRRVGIRFSITCGMNPSVERAVLAIPDQAWPQIRFPPPYDTVERQDELLQQRIRAAELLPQPHRSVIVGRRLESRVRQVDVHGVEVSAEPSSPGSVSP